MDGELRCLITPNETVVALIPTALGAAAGLGARWAVGQSKA